MIDLESDLEELQESEHRWAAKHKRTIEQVKTPKQEVLLMLTWSGLLIPLCVCPQTEQLQQKLIQQKEMNEELEAEKASMERQVMSTSPTKHISLCSVWTDNMCISNVCMDPVSSFSLTQ